MVNGYCKLFLLCRRIDSIFDFALKTHASRAGSFCCSGGPQILSFFIDATKVHLFHCGSRILRQIFFFCAVKTVKVKMVKIENGCCQNRHYNINIYLYIVSKWPRFRNRFWPKWPWPLWPHCYDRVARTALPLHSLHFVLEHLTYGIQIVRWCDAEGEFESTVESCCILEATLAYNVFHWVVRVFHE